MTEKYCIHCVIEGRVQGVWFRASTQTEAKRLGLVGWVRNLPSGQVEVLAAGEKESLEKLYNWLQSGPPLAEVKNITYEELPWQEFDRFSIT